MGEVASFENFFLIDSVTDGVGVTFFLAISVAHSASIVVQVNIGIFTGTGL